MNSKIKSLWTVALSLTLCAIIAGFALAIPGAGISVAEKESSDANSDLEAELRAVCPYFFDLDASGGLQVLVYQMSKDTPLCYMMPGTQTAVDMLNGPNALLDCKPLSVDEVKVILSTYGLDDAEIVIRPFENPLSNVMTWYGDEYLAELGRLFDNRYAVGEIIDAL